MEANKIKLNTVMISILVVATIEIAAQLFIKQNLINSLTGLGLTRFAQIIFLLTIINKYESNLAAIGLASTTVVQGFKKGLIWAVSFGVAAGLAVVILHLFGIKVLRLFQMQLPAENRQLITFFSIGAFLGPVAEEIFFRGILYGFIRRWGIFMALVLSTLLFVLSHPARHTIPLTQVIGGMLFALSYEVEKNLLVPIIIHILGNLAIFTLPAII